MARLFDDANSEYLRKSVAVVTGPPFTIAVWFRPENVALEQTIVGIFDFDAINHREWLIVRGNDAGDPVAYERGDGSNTRIATTTGVTVNTWHLAAARVRAANDWDVTLDGAGKTTSSTSRSPAGLSDTFVGARANNSSISKFMSGRIGPVGIWSLAVSDDELVAMALGASFETIRPADRAGLWPIWGLHSPEIDLSGNQNALTLNGTPSRADHAPVTLHTPKWAATVPLIETAPAATRRIFVVG